MTNAIETKDLTYRPGKSFLLDHLNLRVPAGAIYGFLGPNGAGKTTTIRLVLGLLKPEAGSIAVLGEPVPSRVREVLARTGYVPERPHLHLSLTVEESRRFHRAFYPAWDDSWATEQLRRFGLAPDRLLRQLSKGEMGKLMITLALAQRPELLVLDEPTDGLDPVVRRELLSAMLEYVSERGATVFISSHLVHELERVCDWVGVLDRGRLVSEMPMQDFKNGIKRLILTWPLQRVDRAPFQVLARETLENGSEMWVVRGWQPDMVTWVLQQQGTLREVQDLDLEEAFVELLRSARGGGASDVGRPTMAAMA